MTHAPWARVAVVVASTGRPDCLAHLSRRLAMQSRPPHRVVFSVVAPSDLPARQSLYPDAIVVTGERGLPRQRNRGLELVLGDSDAVAFLDDDYVPSRHALAEIGRFFRAYPDHLGVNGRLLADGINSAGLDFAEAERLVDAWDAAPRPAIPTLRDLRGLYGCNMAFRTAAIGALRFDERLPLYGWQEDVDFSARLGLRGRLARTDAFVGVHCGVKAARASGLRLGYSQVANPLYLAKKGTMPRTQSLRLILRTLAANLVRSLHQEPWVDRRGRLRGNWLALGHALQGTLEPEHILQL
jgi:GT2 family glycosyltransferase